MQCKGQRLSSDLWVSEEKGVHPRTEEKQTRCCQENVCKHAGTVERLSMWAVQGTSEALSRFCVRSGSCGLWKREGLCAILKRVKSFTSAATSTHGASVMLHKVRLTLPIYTMQIVSQCYRIIVGCQGSIDETLSLQPATQRCSMKASLFLATLSLSVLATDHFCLLF